MADVRRERAISNPLHTCSHLVNGPFAVFSIKWYLGLLILRSWTGHIVGILRCFWGQWPVLPET